MRTGSLLHVHETLLSATCGSVMSVGLSCLKLNVDVQLYDGISVPLANVVTSTCNFTPSSAWVTGL